MELVASIKSFKGEYCNREKLMSIGWKEVPWVDGTGINNWEGLKSKLVTEGRGGLVGANGWPRVPLEIRNEEIVGLSNDFCRSINEINSLYEVRDFLSNLSNYEQASRIYTEVYP